jgi:phage FluMu gp28-like protein
MGAFPADEMQKRHGRMRVEPVVFTQQSKEDLATSLYTAFTQKTVHIPRADKNLGAGAVEFGCAQKLRDDLCSIRRVITIAGNIRYDAPHTDEGHADRAWALALALHGCNTNPSQRFVADGR